MPYAAKAAVEHEFLTNLLEIYVTFRNPMHISSEPLTIPAVWNIMPPLDLWLLKVDGTLISVVASEWLDLWTLKLTSDTIAACPAIVTLQYNGPNVSLSTVWRKQWEPFGPIPSTTLPIAVTKNLYPQRATLWHDEAIAKAGNQIAFTVDPGCLYNNQNYQSPASVTDAFSHSFILKAGSYNFYALGVTANNRGLIDYYVDAVKVVSAQDWYSVNPVKNVVKTQTGIVVLTDGYHVLEGKINGKNVNSNNYYMSLTKYWFEHITDPVRT